jgi:two-component system CheB/CheR fusion protein
MSGDQENRKNSEPELNHEQLELIFNHVHNLYGLNLNYYKPATISRRIERRMKMQCCDSLDQYCKIVESDEFELNHLYDDMLIGVTCFFRDTDSFEWLRTNIIPEMIEILKEEGDLRLWTAGCATGEEAYSIMMMLAEEIDDEILFGKVKMFASDTYLPYINKASSGIYSEEEVKNIPENFLRKYFVSKEGGKFLINSSIRNRIIFSQHDITRDPPFTRLHFVSCRNLLIYFNNEARIRALSTFHFTLLPGGTLFLGSSESVSPLELEFSSINRKYNFYRKTGAGVAGNGMRFPIKNRGLSDQGTKIFNRPVPCNNDPRLMRAYDILLERHMPAGFLINNLKEIVHSFGDTSGFIKPKAGRLSLNLMVLVDYNIGIALNDLFLKIEKSDIPLKYSTLTTDSKQVAVTLEKVFDPGCESAYHLVTLEELSFSEKPDIKTEKFNIEGSVKRRIADLEQELFYTKQYLQSTIEELESSNEELLASSEEIQSTNEELQSTNEELCTVNKELEEKIDLLTRANADLDNFMRSTMIATVFVDRNNNIRKFTPSATNIFDLIPQDVGRSIKHINSRLVGLEIDNEIKIAIESGTISEKEICDEKGACYLLKIHPYIDESEKVDGAVISVVNIDVLRKTENLFRKSEEKFTHVFKKMASGAAFFEPLYNESGEIVDCIYMDLNVSYEKIFDIKKEKVIGRSITEIFKDIDPKWLDVYKNVFKTGKAIFAERYHSPTGKYLYSTCFKPEKEENYICVTHIDVSEQKKSQNELNHAEKMNAIGQLAGGVAHDFNNQLTGIMGYASLILQNPESERIHEFAGQILKAAERSGDLTQKLLAFSRKAKLVNVPVDVNKEVVDIIQLLKHSIDKKIVISAKTCDQPCVVSGDSGQIQNAILNLCLNARDAMAKGGNLEISTSMVDLNVSPLINKFKIEPGHYVKITVKDTGKGMTEEIMNKIFEPFFTTRAEEGGVGMGLAAVLGTVQSHFGAIEVKSTVNKGSEFSIYLPSGGDCCKKMKEKTSVSTISIENSTIMVVDDESIVRSIIIEMLELHKSNVIPVTCAKDAIRVYKKEHSKIDLVFLDMVMPDLNGLETFRELKKINKNVKVIILSGYSMNDEINQAISEGAVAFVQKPVSMKVLVTALKDALL